VNNNYYKHAYNICTKGFIFYTDTVRELFIEDLLPPERKLVAFTSRSGAQLKTASKRQLIKWMF
jgi:hypothetical protein